MAIVANKMRSFLTMLGIIIGVFSVTILVSLGQGTTNQVTGQIQSLGSNMITATINSPKPVYITLNDLQTLEGHGGIGLVAPLISRQLVVKNGTQDMTTSIEGTGPGYDTIRDLSVASGRYITQTDLDIRSALAVIGTDVADQIYGTRDVVGSIGIMNIMLVSVTERTREIGIRKAIGAQRSDILIQFLIESMVISLLGGLVGLLLGGVGIRIISRIMGVTMSVTLPVALLAIIFSVTVGVVFGLYPANKASRMRPIEALRYE